MKEPPKQPSGTNKAVLVQNPTDRNGPDWIKVWCLGCGQFHAVAAAGHFVNGDLDNPTIIPIPDKGEFFAMSKCHWKVVNGVMTWGPDSTHHRAGQTQVLSTEASWRPVNMPWDPKLENKKVERAPRPEESNPPA